MENIARQFADLLQEAPLETDFRSQFTDVLKEFTQSNRLLLNVLDNSPDIITAYDTDKRILYWNKACEKNTGLLLKQVIGKNLADVFPDENGSLITFVDKVLAGEEVFIEKRAFKNQEGFFEAKMVPMYNAESNIIGGINYVRDCTDKIISEQKIKKTAQLLAETQQLAKIGVWEWSLDTDKLYWSDEMYRIFGLESTDIEITPTMYLSFIAKQDEVQSAKNFHAKPYITNSENITFTRLIKKPDGSHAHIAGSASYIFDEAGNPLRLTGFIQDVTEKILIEKELKESKLFTQQVTEASPHILYVLDLLQEKYIYVNKDISSFLGYHTAEATNTGNEILENLIHPHDLYSFTQCIETFKNAAIANDEVVICEYRVLDAKGNWRWLNTRNLVFKRDENGKPTQIIGSIQDVTDLKLSEQNLLTINAELERSNNELEQFAYIASHDLKEPLRMITSYAQLLVRQFAKHDESAALYSKFITDGVKNINELIDSLLQYSRVGKKDKEFKKISCNSIVEEIKAGLQIKIDETDTQIIYNQLPEIIGVPVLIKQLFQNLIENSIKFRADNTPVITITADEDEKEWQFYIQDNGIGIDPIHFERIFKIFQRLHSREQFPGSGIGLAVCKKIAEIHKGIIWVESEKGKGSVFSFTIAKPAKN